MEQRGQHRRLLGELQPNVRPVATAGKANNEKASAVRPSFFDTLSPGHGRHMLVFDDDESEGGATAPPSPTPSTNSQSPASSQTSKAAAASQAVSAAGTQPGNGQGHESLSPIAEGQSANTSHNVSAAPTGSWAAFTQGVGPSTERSALAPCFLLDSEHVQIVDPSNGAHNNSM